MDALASAAEGPVNAVTLDPFFISKYELTQGQWMRFSGENPSTYAPPHAADGERIDLRHPVETVSWAAAEETLARLGLLLPTAAQSEYAGRGGTPTAWWTGSEERSLAGAENIVDATYGCGRAVGEEWAEWLDDGYRGHAPAGCYRANGFGLHDVLGNVAEWCYDGAGDYTIPARMGDGLRVGVMLRSGMRVIRGGSFQDRASRARSAFHGEGEPGMRAGWLGVRPVRPVR